MDGDVSVYFGVQKSGHVDIEKRLSRLEELVARIVRVNVGNVEYNNTVISNREGPDRDSNPAPGIHSPRG